MTLRFESVTAAPSLDDVVVQRLPDGRPSAFGRADQGEYLIRFPGIATFAFRAGSDEMRVDAPRTTAPEAVTKLFTTVAVPFALQTAGHEALHASGVLAETGVVAFCGQSGSGKTTFSVALARRPGFQLWADDAVVLGVATGDVYTCLNVPQEANLRPASRAFFGEPVSRIESARDPKEAPLASIVLLDPAPSDAEPTLVRLAVVDALTGILPHAFCFFVDEGREEQTVRALVGLAARVPVLRLRLPAGLDRIDPALDLVESGLRAIV
jgi:hypothetical protein